MFKKLGEVYKNRIGKHFNPRRKAAVYALVGGLALVPLVGTYGAEKTKVKKGTKTGAPKITIIANDDDKKAAFFEWSYADEGYKLAKTRAICDEALRHYDQLAAIGDITADGQDDILLYTNNKLFMINGDSPTLCQKLLEFDAKRGSKSTVTIGDCDNDGQNEVLFGRDSKLFIYGWDGKSLLKKHEIDIAYVADKISVADIDRDENAEILLLNSFVPIRILKYNQGKYELRGMFLPSPDASGKFNEVIFEKVRDKLPALYQGDFLIWPIIKIPLCKDFELFDYNGDSWPDIVICGREGIELVRNGPQNDFHMTYFYKHINGYCCTVVDVEKDGKKDIVVGGSGLKIFGVEDGRLKLKYQANDGRRRKFCLGGKNSVPVMPDGGFYRDIRVFDADNDGRDEILTTENIYGLAMRLALWEYEDSGSPKFRRTWRSDEFFNDALCIIGGDLSDKIKKRVDSLKTGSEQYRMTNEHPLWDKPFVTVSEFREAAKERSRKYADDYFFAKKETEISGDKAYTWESLAEGFHPFLEKANPGSLEEIKELAAYLAILDRPLEEINRARKLMAQGLYLRSISDKVSEGERKACQEGVFHEIMEMEGFDSAFVKDDPFLQRIYNYCKQKKEVVPSVPYSSVAARLNGQKAPELSVSEWINSKPLSLKDLKGKIVHLDFWGTWCGPCLTKMPQIQKYWDNYRNRGFVVIGIHNATKDPEKVREYIRSTGRTFPIAIDKGTGFSDSETWKRYGIEAVPQSVYIDREGIVRYRPGIEELLFEGADPPGICGEEWINSGPISLEDYTGHIIYLDFLNMTDMESSDAMIARERDWREYRDKGLLVIGIHNSITGSEYLRDFIERYDITYPNVIDRDVNNGESETWERYGIDKAKTWVIGKDGKIFVGATGEKIMMELEKKEAPSK